MTDEEIYTRDRRKSAVHEAGHFVIAEWWSSEDLSASIWPIEYHGPGTRMWRGECNGLPIGLSRLPMTMVGVAGVVAAMLDAPETENDPYIATDSLLFYGLGGMSPGDWQAADADPDATDWPTEKRLKRAVRAVAILLSGRLRPRLLQVAEHLEAEGWADADHPPHPAQSTLPSEYTSQARSVASYTRDQRFPGPVLRHPAAT